jgi:hypothetical protein
MELFDRLKDHYEEALEYFDKDHIVGLFLQGSQNYGLDMPGSDVDTKLIVVPSFKDIAMNKKPISTTHIRANEEHIDWKDIRLYMQTFRKQNLNFLEILFTEYFIMNSCAYYDEWMRLVAAREDIARMNPYRSVQSMKGIALEKYHAMEHHYPSKMDIIHKYGFDGKQVHHLLRVEDYLERYIAGEPYESCLRPTPSKVEHMMEYKRHEVPLEIARKEAAAAVAHVEEMAKEFYETHENVENPEVVELLDDVQYNIMKIAVEKELSK